MVGGGGVVLSPVHGGVEKRFDPRGAGLGQGGDDDVRWPRGEARVGDHGADHSHQAGVPTLVMAVELVVGQAFRARQGGDQVGEMLVEFWVGFRFCTGVLLGLQGRGLRRGRHGLAASQMVALGTGTLSRTASS